MTLEDFERVCQSTPAAKRYFQGRWKYMSVVANIVREQDPSTILEIGATDRPVALGCDNMDLSDNKPFPLTYIHDATEIPWPIVDKQYDMVIAMQVFEHLENKQQLSFREIMRVAKSCILSFPLGWDCPGDCHHNITKETIHEWTLGTSPCKIVEVGKRIVYHWKF